MKHYYTDNRDLKSEPRTIEFLYQDIKLTFKSDLGVFSKDRIDYGTQVLLNNLDDFKSNISILDVGAGYGPIGISLAKIYPDASVDMFEVNDRAIELASENINLNKVVNIKISKSDVYTNIEKKYDVIITNPPIRAGKLVVNRILNESIEHLNENGSLWVVIQKKQGAPSTKKKMIEIFGNCEIKKRDKGYYILVSYK
jgi:16S RNA G1207 methylase RsmC